MTKQVEYICAYHANGNLKHEQWGYAIKETSYGSSVGTRHRDDGPALINYDKQGRITQSKWYIKGKVVPNNIVSRYFVDYFNPTDAELLIFKLAVL